jgi:polar amino acid transport system substrate-binding protein
MMAHAQRGIGDAQARDLSASARGRYCADCDGAGKPAHRPKFKTARRRRALSDDLHSWQARAAPGTGSRRAFVRGAIATAGAAAALASTGVGTTIAAPALQSSLGTTLDDIQKRGSLRTATFLNYPPFGLRDDQNNPVGYDVDIGAEMAKALGVKHEIVEVTTATARIPTVVTGAADVVIANFAVTLERAKSIMYTTPPYVKDGQALIVSASSGIRGVNDPKLKSVGVTTGSTGDLTITALRPDMNIQRFDTSPAALQAVKQGLVDAYTEDYSWCIYQAKQDPNLAAVGPPLSLQYEAWGVRPGDHDWLQWLNLFAFLWQASGSNATSWKKWFGVDADKIWPDF